MSVQAYEVRRVMRGRLRMTVIGFMLLPCIRMNFSVCRRASWQDFALNSSRLE